jgi:acetyltransferase-like isoleucine patch superfamily enzyme
MKDYIKNAIKELQDSDKLKIEVNLENKDDYKKSFLRLLYNKFILTIQKKMVPMHLKNFILRTTGMNVGKDVCVPHDIYFDPYFPELIYLDNGCLIGGESKVYTHEIKEDKLILGKAILKERTLIGGMSVLKPGSVVNKNSMLMFFSDLDGEVPEGELYGGKPAKQVMKFSPEDIEKFFKPSNMQYKEYYKEFKEKVEAFLEDSEKTFFKIHYNGKRLNAGDDWWRARNVLRIFYNGIIIEITRLLPHCFLKTLLLKMVGVKLGKNCKIGKGVVFDHIYCDTITLEDDVVIDNDVYFDGHEYTITQTVFGKTLVKKGAHIKHHSFARIGTTIGENSVIESYSVAQREIPSDEVWGGVPAKFIRKK